ncbi:MAG: tetratricopeptide repeat protein [Bdellovibrionales bacterium]|nr:tetratricopeptide repeat protein [Bdellovibrionales bacterium]
MRSRLNSCRGHYLLALVVLMIAPLWGCVVPPDDLGPNVYSAEEIELVTLVRQGKEYARAGRNDLAEVAFRRALTLTDQYPSIYNDLAYTLAAQNRVRESIATFQAGLKRSPTDADLLRNLAKALFKAERYEAAQARYEELLEIHVRGELTTVDDPKKGILSVPELAEIFRELAVVEFQLGLLDEAICHSSTAVIFGPGAPQVVRHARVLLASGRYPLALVTLKELVLKLRDEAPSDLVFDYGLALAAMGDLGTAEGAFNRVLARPDAGEVLRRNSKLLLAVIAERTQRPGVSEGFIVELAADNDRLCTADSDREAERYWPITLADTAKKLIEEYCLHEHAAES